MEVSTPDRGKLSLGADWFQMALPDRGTDHSLDRAGLFLQNARVRSRNEKMVPT